MAEQDRPLTDLCSICYINLPKYVCPRDKVRTCSLPCYKRHQQRASCNGKRDATAYIKKNDLTTPAGIDHDYNFLSGIERTFDEADKTLDDRGIGEGGYALKKRWHETGALQRYLRENRIRVDRAPPGMTRQKQNQTRWIQKSKRIVWTVEWVDVDGAKRLSEVAEAATISEAYAAMLDERDRESRKRKRDGPDEQTVLKAQKLPASLNCASAPEADEASAAAQDEPRAVLAAEAPVSAPVTAEHGQPADSLQRLDSAPPLASQDGNSNNEPQNTTQAVSSLSSPESDDTRSRILLRIESEQNRQAALRPEGPPYFYLLKPHTSTTSRVLVPLQPTSSLTSSLHEQIVLEFPTLYVLEQAQDVVPEGFISEKNYYQARADEDKEVEEMLAAVPGSSQQRVRREVLSGGIFGSSSQDPATSQGGAQWDENKILDMLKRDVI